MIDYTLTRLKNKFEELGYKRETAFYWTKKFILKYEGEYDDGEIYLYSNIYVENNKIYVKDCFLRVECEMTSCLWFHDKFKKAHLEKIYTEHCRNIREIKKYE